MRMMFGSKGITHTNKYYYCRYCVFNKKLAACPMIQCGPGVYIPVHIKTDVFNL
jgi:hypothetical protein